MSNHPHKMDYERIAFLSSLHEFHVNGGYDDCEPVTIQEVVGNINDREYVEIGKGDTLIEAIDDAIRHKPKRRRAKGAGR